ncbi:MAG: hypothetical protein PHR16_00025 [Methylovulum sp.]|nr:hypothetical protein [Methylovulum sp.]
MKKNNLTNSLFAVLFLASPLVSADAKYPAADFRPEVVYQDADYISKNSQLSEKNLASEVSAADSKYPAANFEPQVIYADPDYKHSSSTVVATKSVENETSVSVNENNVQASETNKKDKSSPNYLIGILGLAAIGVFLFRKQFQSGSKGSEKNESVLNKGVQKLTGVSRYLNKVSGTGVSRYLDKQVKPAVAVTGVAKYVAKQVTATKTSVEQAAATGVEKYMRNRG